MNLNHFNLGLALASLTIAVSSVAASYPQWQEGNTYATGTMVSYNNTVYQALVTHTAYVGANWNPAATPTLWAKRDEPPPPSLVPTQLPATPTPKPTAAITIVPTVRPTPTLIPLEYCSSQPLWNSSIAYTAGAEVRYNNAVYKVQWWSQGDNPAQSASWGPWIRQDHCSHPVTPTPTATPSATPTPTASPTPTAVPTLCPTLAPPVPGMRRIYNDPTAPCGIRDELIGNVVPFDNVTIQSAGSNQLRASWRIDAATLPGFVPDRWQVFNANRWPIERTATVGQEVVGGKTYYFADYTFSTAGALQPSYGIQLCSGTYYSCVVSAPVAPAPYMPPPKPRLSGYWQNFANASGAPFPLRDVSGNWDVILLAYGVHTGHGTVVFTPDPAAGSDADFIADIAAKRASGKKVLLALGGSVDNPVLLNNPQDIDNFVNSVHGLITHYGLDGIDIDLDAGSGITVGSPAVVNLVTAVQQLKARVGAGFYLALAPEHAYVQGGYSAYTHIWGAHLPLIDALRNDINVVQVRYFNSGALLTPYSSANLNPGSVDMLVAGSLMLLDGFTTGTGQQFAGLRQDQVGFAVPTSANAAFSGVVTADTVGNAVDCLMRRLHCGSIVPTRSYPLLQGVLGWSINWDRYDGSVFSSAVKGKFNTVP